MYYHRVLPPLPSLPNSSSSGRHARRDALKEHRIMTDDRRAQSTDRSASCETSSTRRVDVDRAAKDTGKRHRSVDSQSPGPNKRSLSRGLDEDDEADVEDQGDDSSYVDDDSCRSGSRASVPPSGDTNSVCLCQPDPKVPRPRNGELLHFPKMSYYGVSGSTVLICCLSLHSISSALPRRGRSQAPEVSQPRDLKDYRRTLATSAPGDQRSLESISRGTALLMAFFLQSTFDSNTDNFQGGESSSS